ncbi:hypothetical protein [[Kitasatospora] papulosa]|uniref:hypothetical protein n=1 Tax=[Kitasatospora] papulosa TaxID=1464011 RepID=UPI0036C75683
MGRATDALLVYGHDLGGNDEWKVKELDKYGGLLETSWYSPVDDEADEDESDFATCATQHLIREIAGFREKYLETLDTASYWDRLRDAEQRVGVRIASYCSDGAPSYMLAAHVTRIARGDIEEIDPVDLVERPALMGWDKQLAAALDALGLTPLQKTPRWLLASYGSGF